MMYLTPKNPEGDPVKWLGWKGEPMKNKGKGNKLGDLIWPEIMKICSKTRGSKELDLLEVGSMKESWPYDEKGNPKDGYAVAIEEVIRKYREGKDERRKGWK